MISRYRGRGPRLWCLALLLGTSVLAQTIDDIAFPNPPEGFTWKKLPEVKAAFLLPDGWYYLHERRNGTEAYFITREEIEGPNLFKAGLTINVIRDAKQRVGLLASEYAQRFIGAWSSRAEILDAWQHSAGVLESWGVRVKEGAENDTVVIHVLAIGNTRTDTLYILFFEAPLAEWDRLWEAVGSNLLRLFFLDDEV